MSDFDVDKFMSERKAAGGQQPASAAPAFDVDAFMQGRAKPQPQRRPATVLPQDRQQFKQPRLGYDNPRGVQPYAPTAPGVGGNVSIGSERGYRKYLQPAISSLAEVTEGAKVGNFKPALQMGREALRGTLNALKPPDPQYKDGKMTAIRPPDPALQEAQRQREQRYAASPEGQRSAQRLAELDERAALDPSYAGKAVRGVSEFATGAAPTLAAAIASRGALPIVALTAAAQSANNPAMMGPSAAASMLPAPSVAPIIRRLRGRPQAPMARPTNPQAIRDTQPMPAIQGPGRPTAQLPRIEDAPTAPLPARLPVRQTLDEMPPLIEAEPRPFAVRENLNPRRDYAEVRGPRFQEEMQLQLSNQKAKAAAPPVVPPNIDDALEKWARQPKQAPLFEASAKSPWQDSVLAYYRANLLTNPAGRALDLGSTIVNQAADAAVRPVAAAVDVIVSKLTKQRSITGPSLAGSGRAFGSIRQGLRDARDVLRTGQQTIDSGADDILYGSEIRSGLGKAFDVPVNGVFRVLGAMDAPFRRFGFERNLADRALVAAKNEAKAGRIPRSQVKARAAELVDRGDIIDAAVRDGERAVLSEPNRISSWLSSQTRNSPNARLAIGIVQPFMRIPLNAILRSADFSGVGGIKALYKVARGVGRKAKGQSFFRDLEEQRVFAQNVASGSFGPAAFLLGMELEDSGKLEGYYYTSKKDFPSGATPTSIEIGGERYDVNRLGGFVMAPLFIGATYNRLRREGSDQANALLRSFSGLAQQAPALGYYGAPAKAGRILTADEPGNEIIKEAGSITSGFIPASGATGFAAKAIDKGRNREAEGFTGPIMSRIPGLRSQLPEKAKAALLDEPAEWRSEQKAAGERRMSVSPRRADKDSRAETPAEFSARRNRVNQMLRQYGSRLVGSSAYKGASTEERKAMREYLRQAIGRKDVNVGLLDPLAILSSVRESAYQKKQKGQK